jgi:hypothetical protein
MSDGSKKNDYFLDDALDWLREHISDAPEDAIARALIKALDDDEWQVHLEIRLDSLMQAEADQRERAI